MTSLFRKVLVIVEDEVVDRIILKPVVSYLLASTFKLKQKEITVNVTAPSKAIFKEGKGRQAVLNKEFLKAAVKRYQSSNLLILVCVDRDSNDNTRHSLVNFETFMKHHITAKGSLGVCIAAWQEIEAWMMAAFWNKISKPQPFQDIRLEKKPSETMLKEFMIGLGHGIGGDKVGPDSYQAAMANFDSSAFKQVESKCPEIADLKTRLSKYSITETLPELASDDDLDPSSTPASTSKRKKKS